MNMTMSPELESILQKQQAQIDTLRGEIRDLITKMGSNSTSTGVDCNKGMAESHKQDKNQANELEDLRKNIRESEAKQAKQDAEISTIREEMKNIHSVLSRYEVNFRVDNMRDQEDTEFKPGHIDVNESFDDNEVVNRTAFVPNGLMEVGNANSGMVHNQITNDSKRKESTKNINITNDSTEVSTATSRAAKTASPIIRGPEWDLQKDIGGDVNNTYDDKITNDSERKESIENINVIIESNPSANTRHPLQVIRRRAGGLISRYVIGSTRRNPNDSLYVSDSFHMYTAATISDDTCSPVFGWFVTLIAQLIIIAQVIVLMALVLESSHPSCISHEECQVGEYCEWKYWGSGPPRCFDCGEIPDSNVNCSSVIDEINENDEYTKYVNKIAWKTDELYTDSELTCFAQAYCNETNVSMKCEYLQYEGVKCSLTQRLAIIFMSLLFCAPLIGYIQDAIVEERYLNYALKKYPMTRTMQLAAEILRIAIRTRQILIPWFGTAAVLSIIIRDPLDIKNLMLNVLAVEVTLIADDLLALIVLPIFNTDAVVKLAQDASREGPVKSSIWPRVLGVCIGIVLITSIFYMEPLIMFFTGNWDNGLCSSIDNMIYIYIVYILPMSAILLRRVGGFVIGKLKRMTWAKTTLRFVAKTTMDFFVVYYVKLMSEGVVYQTTLPQYQFSAFYFLDKFKLYPSQEIWLSFVLVAVYICGHAIRIYSSWTPFCYLHSSLYWESNESVPLSSDIHTI